MDSSIAAAMFAALGDEGRLELYQRLVRSGAAGLAGDEIEDIPDLMILTGAGLVIAQTVGLTEIYRASPIALAECVREFVPNRLGD